MRSLHYLFTTGIVLPYALPTAPTGWLLCNGQALTAGTADNLRAALIAAGNPYGVSGSDPLLPDLRGEFVRGADAGRGVDTGRVLGSSQASAFAEHLHATLAKYSGSTNNYASPGGNVIASNLATGSTAGEMVNSHTVTTKVGGAETRPRNVAMNFIIKT